LATASWSCGSTTAPGYRVYFMRRVVLLVLLLCGGDKSSEQKDIAQAKLIAEHFED